jgi:hypothetical protein
MKTTSNAQEFLSATARRRDDGMVIYSQEGTPIQNRVLPLEQIPGYLSHNGAFSRNVEEFMSTLTTTDFAEIHQRKLWPNKFWCLG